MRSTHSFSVGVLTGIGGFIILSIVILFSMMLYSDADSEVTSFDFSPDGKKVVYALYNSSMESSSLHVINERGEEVRIFGPVPEEETTYILGLRPQFLPDSTTILFFLDGELHQITSKGTDLKEIPLPWSGASDVVLDSTGTAAYYVAAGAGDIANPYYIAKLDLKTMESTQLTTIPHSYISDLRISADGTALIYHQSTDTDEYYVLLDLKSNQTTRIDFPYSVRP